MESAHTLGHMPVVIAWVHHRLEDQTLTAQIAEIETELVVFLSTEDQVMSEEGMFSLDRAITLAQLQTFPGIGFLTAS